MTPPVSVATVSSDAAKCCGCGACSTICPVGCVEMQPDREGFLYPYVQEGRCVRCSRCLQVCPEHSSVPGSVGKYYAAFHNNPSVRKKSSSGGAFTALTDCVLAQNGVVYGCAWQDVDNVVHKRAATKQERDSMRGSKYIQSQSFQHYKQVHEDLLQGMTVYFSGTPCQIQALLSYLKQMRASTNHLITQEVLCHGVASPLYFAEYLRYWEHRFHSPVVSCHFRAKSRPGKKQEMEIVFENGRRYRSLSAREDLFYKFYHQNLTLRPSCYQCAFARPERAGDLILGDFWGAEHQPFYCPEVDDYTLCISNGSKAEALLKACADSMTLNPVCFQQAMQNALLRPAARPGHRETFWKELLTNGFAAIARRYGNDNLRGKAKLFMLWVLDKTRLYDWIKKRMRKRCAP